MLHGVRVVCVVVPMMAICSVVLVWPMCIGIKGSAEHMLQTELDGEIFALNPFTWKAGFRERLRDIGPHRIAILVRESVFVVLTFVSFGPFCYYCLRHDEVGKRRLWVALQVVQFLLVFAIGFSFTSAAVSSDVVLGSPTFEPLLRCVFHSVTWLPLTAVTMLLPLPRSAYPRVCRRIFGVMAVSVVVYFGWRVLCATYFSIRPTWLRAFVGVLAPPCVTSISFEAYYQYSLMLVEYHGLPCALLWLNIPVCFVIATSATLQHGSSSIGMGVVMEIASSCVELRLKRGMLYGRTPLEDNLRLLRWGLTRGRRCTVTPIRPELQVIPVEPTPIVPVPTAPSSPPSAWLDVQGDSGLMDSSASKKSGSDATPDLSEGKAHQTSSHSLRDPVHFNLLLAMAIYSNIVELVVHTTVGAFYVLARLNPNDASGIATPASQVLSLLAVKLVCEVVTDCLLAFWASRSCVGSRTKENIFQGLRNLLTWGQKALMVAMAFLWAMDSQTLFVLYLCPFSDPSAEGPKAELGSLGLCPVDIFI